MNALSRMDYDILFLSYRIASLMAGHSKWKNIQHRKGAQDAKRGKIFTRLIREITIAAKVGPDPATNPRLRSAIDKGLDNNMSKDTIQKAILKGAGSGEDQDLMEMTYEGYAPGGIAFLVECATDNKNRTVSEIRHFFTKAGGSLGTPGSVQYLFKEVGLIEVAAGNDREKTLNILLESSWNDLEEQDQCFFIQCESVNLTALCAQWAAEGLNILSQESTKIPLTKISVSAELEEKIQNLYDKLDDHDDVQALYCNMEWSEEDV